MNIGGAVTFRTLELRGLGLDSRYGIQVAW